MYSFLYDIYDNSISMILISIIYRYKNNRSIDHIGNYKISKSASIKL